MSVNYSDIVSQTWDFRMPKPENSNFQHGIKPRNMHRLQIYDQTPSVPMPVLWKIDLNGIYCI